MKRKRPLFILGFMTWVMSYYIIRFSFSDLHMMFSWTDLMAGIALIIMIVSIIFNKKATTMLSTLGLIISFVIGLILSADSVDQGGGLLNNHWLIWTVTYLIMIIVGLVIDYRKEKQ